MSNQTVYPSSKFFQVTVAIEDLLENGKSHRCCTDSKSRMSAVRFLNSICNESADCVYCKPVKVSTHAFVSPCHVFTSHSAAIIIIQPFSRLYNRICDIFI